jgi:hypothetical protein
MLRRIRAVEGYGPGHSFARLFIVSFLLIEGTLIMLISFTVGHQRHAHQSGRMLGYSADLGSSAGLGYSSAGDNAFVAIVATVALMPMP